MPGISNPLTPEPARLADAWWLERRAEPHSSEAWYTLQMLARTRPADAWQVFLALAQRLTGVPAPLTREDQLHSAVASVLGDVLEADAAAFAEHVEQMAADNPVVRRLLGRLTLHDDAAPRATLERLKAASGGRLRIAPAPGSTLGKVAFEVADEYRAGTLCALRRLHGTGDGRRPVRGRARVCIRTFIVGVVV